MHEAMNAWLMLKVNFSMHSSVNLPKTQPYSKEEEEVEAFYELYLRNQC